MSKEVQECIHIKQPFASVLAYMNTPSTTEHRVRALFLKERYAQLHTTESNPILVGNDALDRTRGHVRGYVLAIPGRKTILPNA